MADWKCTSRCGKFSGAARFNSWILTVRTRAIGIAVGLRSDRPSRQSMDSVPDKRSYIGN